MVAKFARCGIGYAYRNGRLELISPPPSSLVLPKYYFDKGVLRRKEYLSQRNSRKASLHTLIDEPGTMAVEGVKEYHRIMGKSFDFPDRETVSFSREADQPSLPGKGSGAGRFRRNRDQRSGRPQPKPSIHPYRGYSG
jgi:hypothetical protein